MSIPTMHSGTRITIASCQKDIGQNSIYCLITHSKTKLCGILKPHILVLVQSQSPKIFWKNRPFPLFSVWSPGKWPHVTLWKNKKNTVHTYGNSVGMFLKRNCLLKRSGSVNWIKLGIWMKYDSSLYWLNAGLWPLNLEFLSNIQTNDILQKSRKSLIGSTIKTYTLIVKLFCSTFCPLQ